METKHYRNAYPFIGMELQQLHYCVEIATAQSFSAAARTLGVSQPALSRSIAKLEEEIGQPVFERGGRQLTLTEAGKLLVERARRVLLMIDDTKAQITDDGETGLVRVAAIPTIAPYLLPHLLGRLTRALPQARIEIHECVTAECVRRAHHGEIDVALVALPIDGKYLEVEHLFDEELLLVTPTGHPLAAQEKVRSGDIEPYPFVLLGEAHCLTDDVRRFCQRKNVQPVVVGEAQQLATVLELVAMGHGVSLIPEMTRRLDRNPLRVYRSIAGDGPKRQIALVSNPYRFRTQLLLRMMQLVRDEAKAHAAACATHIK